MNSNCETEPVPKSDVEAQASFAYSRLQSWYFSRLQTESGPLSEYSIWTATRRLEDHRKVVKETLAKRQLEETQRNPKLAASTLATLGLSGVTLLVTIGVCVVRFDISALAALAITGICLSLAFFTVRRGDDKMLENAINVALCNGADFPLPEGKTKHTRKIIADAVIEQSLRQRVIIDYAKDWIFALSVEMAISCTNLAAFRVLGFAPMEIVGQRLSTICVRPSEQDLQMMLADPEIHPVSDFVATFMSKSGDLVDFHLSCEWSKSQRAYFVIAKDVTTEQALLRAREEFVSMISHDIRTPLHSVLLSLGSLLNGVYGTLNEPAVESIGRAKRGVATVIELIEELIELERTSEQAFALSLSEFNLNDCIEEAIDKVYGISSALDVGIERNCHDVTVQADRKRILRVMTNLLSNALKFSPAKSTVSVKMIVKKEHVEVRVEDQGPGIPAAESKAVFRKYYQLDRNQPQSQALIGSGLGLAICRAFLEAHGGLIGVDRRLEGGSSFWFTLPLRQIKPQTG
jgi:signal transduction histidine kinase